MCRASRAPRRSLVAAVLLGALALSSERLQAQPAPRPPHRPLTAALDWQVGLGARDCTEQPALELAVAARLERTPFVPRDRADVQIEGLVARRRATEGYAVTLTTHARDGRVIGMRELESESDDCRDLDDAVALVIALVIDSPETRSRIRVPRRSKPWRGEIEAAGAAVLGLMPALAFGPRLAGRVEPPGVVPIEIAVGVLLVTEAEIDGKGARLYAWQAGLSLCPAFTEGSLVRLGGCAGIEAGALQASGFGLEVAREPTRPLLSLAARASLGLYLDDHLILTASLGASLPALRDRFTYTAADGSEVELHRAAPINGTASLGLALPIP